jgi:hypothetical protein
MSKFFILYGLPKENQVPNVLVFEHPLHFYIPHTKKKIASEIFWAHIPHI